MTENKLYPKRSHPQPRRTARMHRLVLACCAVLFLPCAVAAAPIRTEGHLLCNDDTPVVGCAVTLSYRDSSGVIASRTATTGTSGEFEKTLICPFSNQVGEHYVITAKCCNQSWTVSSSSCSGDLGTFVCDNCGGAGCV